MLRVERVSQLSEIEAGTHLLDGPSLRDASYRFLSESGHHLLMAYDQADTPIGFVSGVEMTHPDKGTEMFLYELGVDESARRGGVATALVTALAALARERGCYGMWALTDFTNPAAMATYRAAGGEHPTSHALFAWSFGAPDGRHS